MRISRLTRFFLRDRGAATALVLAIMTVPLLIAASAAVDIARAASARAALQASVDGAAQAGLGAYQLSSTSSKGSSVAQSTFTGTSLQLSSLVAISNSGNATIGTYCGAGLTTANCGGGDATTADANGAGCKTGFTYCVVVTASATLKNSLFAFLIPSELLTASSKATSFAKLNVGTSNVTSNGIPSAYDGNTGYVKLVSLNADGTPNYSASNEANSSCYSLGGVFTEITLVQVSASTPCNYLLIGSSTGASSSGSLTGSANQPVAFGFINDTGDTTGYGGLDGSYSYTTNIWVNGTAYPQGDTVANTPVCTKSTTRNGKTTCTSYSYPTVALTGECPYHTLYGSITQGSGAPSYDSITDYSSAYEVAGLPPTHNVNHVLVPFEDTSVLNETYNGVTYKVQAECPNWPLTAANGASQNTAISAPVSASYAQANANTSGLNTYSTYYPDTPFVDDTVSTPIDGGASTDVFPPSIAGCTPVTTATTATPYATSNAAWWGWSPSNLGSCNPTNGEVGTTNRQSAAYNNCALIIRPLGTAVPVVSGAPMLPDYYTMIEDTSGNILAFEPFYDATTYTDPLPEAAIASSDSKITESYNSTTGVYTVVNKHPAGYTPTSTSTSRAIGANGIDGNGLYAGDVVVTETPAQSGSGYDHNLPQVTSSQCYNPSVATQNNGYVVNNVATPGYNADGSPIDPVANPQLGAVFCNTSPPQSYGLYWNDMGAYASDDLGYWNEITVFTCPTSTTAAASGSSGISG